MIGDKALLPQSAFERLVELAQRYEGITVQMQDDDLPTLGIMCLTEQSGAFDFWQEEWEDIYSFGIQYLVARLVRYRNNDAASQSPLGVCSIPQIACLFALGNARGWESESHVFPRPGLQ